MFRSCNILSIDPLDGSMVRYFIIGWLLVRARFSTLFVDTAADCIGCLLGGSGTRVSFGGGDLLRNSPSLTAFAIDMIFTVGGILMTLLLLISCGLIRLMSMFFITICIERLGALRCIKAQEAACILDRMRLLLDRMRLLC